MASRISKAKQKEWLKRYLPAEILATALAVVVATFTYNHTSSYIASAASGWVAEGIGFYGYFITLELLSGAELYKQHGPFKRIMLASAAASTNLLIEFLPAEILDNFIIRPFLLYWVPMFIHPYAFGFLVGKLASDALFYGMAIIGYEARKHWLPRLQKK